MLPGLFKDFAYERLGVPSFVLELGLFYNYLGLETADLAMPYEEYEREWKCRAMAWHDDNPEYGLFHDWKWVEHSQLDAVDIGGWDRVLFSNPPKGEMPGVADRVGEFVEQFATWAPDAVVADAEVERIRDAVHRVRVTVVNEGSLPTNVTERGREIHPRSEPVVTLDSPPRSAFVVGGPKQRIDHLAAGGRSETVGWVVRVESAGPFEVTVRSPRDCFDTQTV